jgi:hypothetical protein
MKQRFASVFRRLSEWLDPRAERDLLGGLTGPKIQALRDLVLTDEWDVFLDVLDREQTLVGENIITCTDTNMLHQYRGHVIGLRDAGSMIQRIVDADNERKKTDERSRSATERADDHKLSATYGSPYWNTVRGRAEVRG